jgi:protein-L-isoaspartate(D-aspartate) O-methyltransferase
MTQMLAVEPGVRVLEIGTGSGYQTAVLAELGAEVWSVEVVPGLAARARQTLASLGYMGLQLRTGNGSAGWPEAAPFARIILTAAPVEVPQALVDQLADGGRLVAPVGGDEAQVLVALERHGEDVTRTESMAVRFVRMT